MLKFFSSQVLIAIFLLACQSSRESVSKEPSHEITPPQGLAVGTKKIALVMFYTENYKIFADIAKEINQIYADKFGYKLIAEQDILVDTNEYTLHWNKYKSLAKYIKDYDYIVWIDADAVVMKQDVPLESFLNNRFDKEVIVADDMWQTHAGNMNTGVIIFKGGDWSFQLLEHMMVAKECVPYHKNAFHDQTCLELMRSTNYAGARNKIKIIDHKPFQGPQDGAFIFHMAGTSDKNKIAEEFQKILAAKKQ